MALMKGIKERCIKDFRQVFKVFLVTHYCNTQHTQEPVGSKMQYLFIHFSFQDPFVLNHYLVTILQNKVSVILQKNIFHRKNMERNAPAPILRLANVLFPILRLIRCPIQTIAT